MNFLSAIPKWAWAVIGAVLLVVGFLIERDAYGDRRARQAEIDTDAKWKKASDEVIRKAQAGATEADRKAAARAADYAAKVEAEKKRIEKATAEGSSPFDVLFGSK